jgi:hypothetical protein
MESLKTIGLVFFGLFMIALAAVAWLPLKVWQLGTWFTTKATAIAKSHAEAAATEVAKKPAETPKDIAVKPVFSAEPLLAECIANIADFHITVRFSESFAATVSIYKAQKLVRRKMRAISPPASTLMKSTWLTDVWAMRDISLADGMTYEKALQQTEEDGIAMIKEMLGISGPQYLSSMAAFQAKHAGKSVALPPVVIDEIATNRALAILRKDAAVAPVTGIQFTEKSNSLPPVQEVRASENQVKRSAETDIEGKVVFAEMRKMLNADAIVFEVTIETEGGESYSHRGVRLQEIFKDLNVEVGDFIRLRALGRTSVAGGKARNEFEVKLLKKATERA